jgi:ubiquinone/menaquinone biosynthesis C-methylase UbiE
MTSKKSKFTEEEADRINKVQSDFFSDLIHVFDPPLPEGVPERLNKIVAVAGIEPENVVMDVGSGTGILIPLIRKYTPKTIYANDLSQAMLDHLSAQYPFVHTIVGDVRNVALPDESLDVVFMNACYPNIVDKDKSNANISRMLKVGGRVVISHPMGKAFIDTLKNHSPFPLDDFPDDATARTYFRPYGFEVVTFIDETQFYLLLLEKQQ